MIKLKNSRAPARFAVAILAALLLLPVLAAPAAAYDDIPIYIDGRAIVSGQARLVDSVTYVPFRAFAESLGATVTWNASTRTATAATATTTVTAAQGGIRITANGRHLYTVGKVLNLYGTLYVPVRPMAKAFCMDLRWDGAARTVSLTTSGRTLASGDSFYRADEVYWLARIIHAEAGAEPMLGKIAVGNVILNRVRSPLYPNTIYGVIFDRRYGTQFSPVSFGTIYNTPSADSISAAKMCLDGANLSSDILFFMNPRLATTNWISQNRPYAFTVGNHDFYY